MTKNIHDEVAAGIAFALGETESDPISQISRIIEKLGAVQAIELVKEARSRHREGSMPTMDGSRQRTLGGIWFLLCYQRLKKNDREYVWPGRTETAAAYRAERKRQRQEQELIEV